MAGINEQIEILINKILSKNAPSILEFLTSLSQQELQEVGLTKEDVINGDLNHIIHSLHQAKLLFNFQLNGIVNGARETGQSVERILKSSAAENFRNHSNVVTRIISYPAIDETDKFLHICERIRGIMSPQDAKLRMLASLELKTFGKGK